MTAWKRTVARAFDRAQDYDRGARIQAIVADRLAATVSGERLVRSPRTLEIGCGTGLLTQALRARVGVGPMLVTDIAPAMLARCRARIGLSGDVSFAAMDGERPALAPGFDLIVSSLAAQWFVDLEQTLQRLAGLLRPGGLLAVTTLAAGTFQEWAEARGETAPAPAYPSLERLQRMRCAGCVTEIACDRLEERHADGTAFLRDLRIIGADTAAETAAVLSPGALRRALRAFDARGASITYVVATCLIRRSDEPTG